MARLTYPTLVMSALATLTAQPAAAQYRRQVEELAPAFAVEASVGAFFSFAETMTPIETPQPEQERRGVREIESSPWVSVQARYGRGIAVYGNAGVALPGEAEMSGTDPLTGEPLDGTRDIGTVALVSAGVSFAPLRDAMGLRIDAGPAWVDLGNGGSYVALRIAASARFLEIGDRGAVLLAWDGWFAGGQHDRQDVEYQIRKGMLSGVRVGYEMAW